MASILKEGKTFRDKHGNINSEFVAYIDQCNGNKNREEQYYSLEIYKNAQARADKDAPAYQKNYVITGDEFDEQFSDAALKLAGITQYKAAYLNSLTQEIGTGEYEEELDEDGAQVEIMELEWKDWEIDE